MPTRPSPLIAAVLAILFVSFASLARAQTTVDQYNSQGQPTGSFETQGTVTGFTYDTGINGLVVASENNGTSSLTQYDSNGNPIQSTTTPQPLGPLIYDSQNGNVIGVGPGRGNVTLYNYDARDRQTMTEQILLPNNGGVSNGTYAGDPNQIIIGSPDRLGITTEYQYDSNFQLQGQFDVMGDATSITYDPTTQDYFVAADVNGQWELEAYDSHGNFLDSLSSLDGVSFPTGSGPNGLAVGDFTGNGSLDVLTPSQNGNSASVLYNVALDPVTGQPLNKPTVIILGDPADLTESDFAAWTGDRGGNVYIAITPENASLALLAPSLCLFALLLAAGAIRARRRYLL